MNAGSIFHSAPQAPCPPNFNLAAHVLAAAKTTPEKPALEILSSTTARRWTYREVEHAVLATAGGLRALGLPDGARILLRVGDEVSFPLLFLGAVAAGYVPSPSSAQLTAPEVDHLIRLLAPALICVGTGIDAPQNPGCRVLLPDDIAALQVHAPASFRPGNPDRLAYVIPTSGTAGAPRLVEHAHRAVWARRMMWQGWYGLCKNDRLLHAGAMNWTYTLGTGLCDPWAIGATALIAAPGTEAHDLPGLLGTHRASLFAAAPGIFRRILGNAGDISMPKLRHALSAGEKLPPEIRARWQARTGTAIYEALGMSEISTFISSSPANPTAEPAIGRPQDGRHVAVIDPGRGAPVPFDQPGILAVSRDDPGLMRGYFRNPSATAAQFRGDWFLTGDIVAMRPDGEITYLGREDDMMNAGGFRVSPIEVEAVLNRHPAIEESAAAAVEVKPGTHVIAAFYQALSPPDDAALLAYCSARLARYKCPRLFIRVDTLPKSANGKLRRAALRAQYAARHRAEWNDT